MDPFRIVSLVVKLLFFMHKTTGKVRDPLRLVILVQKVLFSIQKPHMKAGTHGDMQFWS